MKYRAMNYQNQWVFGRGVLPLNEEMEKVFLICDSDVGLDLIKVRPQTIGKFSGFFDANGSEIYENDVVEANGVRFAIIFWRGAICLMAMNWLKSESFSRDECYEHGAMPIAKAGFFQESEQDHRVNIIGNLHPEFLLDSDEVSKTSEFA